MNTMKYFVFCLSVLLMRFMNNIVIGCKGGGSSDMEAILERVDEKTRETFVNVFNIYHHDRASLLPEEYQAVDDAGYYDKPNTVSIMSDYPTDKVLLYIIKHDDKVAGFVVLASAPYTKRGSDYAIVDFFVLNNFRNKGIATRACEWLFSKYPGRYWMEIIKKDSNAITFWINLIAKRGNIISINEIDSKLIEFEFEVSI